MANCKMLLVGVLLVVGIAFCGGQSQTTTAVPPNCVCPTPSPAMMAMMTTNSMQMGGQFPGMQGRPHKMMKDHGICGSDGRNYTTRCDFTNAMALNQNLGKRPCSGTGGQQMRSTMRPNRPNHVDRYSTDVHTFCMTNGQTMNVTKMALDQQMATDTTLAVRCQKACPCPALVCPTMHGGHGGQMQGGRMQGGRMQGGRMQGGRMQGGRMQGGQEGWNQDE